jgi:hypothetical protein
MWLVAAAGLARMNLSRLNGRRTPLSPPFLSLFLSPSLSLTALRAPFDGAASCFVWHRAKQLCYEECRLVRVWCEVVGGCWGLWVGDRRHEVVGASQEASLWERHRSLFFS